MVMTFTFFAPNESALSPMILLRIAAVIFVSLLLFP